jgi:molecular chaperone HscB
VQCFEVFDVPAQFTQDLPAIERHFRALQAATHPDKFASADDTARRLAQQRSTLVNDAYRTLKDPVARACSLIVAATGVHPLDEMNTAMPRAFLMQQMDLREDIANATARKDVSALESFEETLADDRRNLESTIARLLDVEHNFAEATTAVRQLRFLVKVGSELDDALSALS